MRRTLRAVLVAAAAIALSSCGGAPDAGGLRDSFVAQLTANRWVKNVERSGDDIRFAGPGIEGKDQSMWRVHIDVAQVEENADAARPFKGMVRSSWYADDLLVKPRGRDSNLPIGLQSNGLAQECWAFWEMAAKRWSWE